MNWATKLLPGNTRSAVPSPGLPSGETLDDSARGPILAGIAIIVAFVAFLGGWVAIAPLEGAVIASGVVKVEGNRKSVQHLDGGIVKELLVAEGDRVKAGQILLVLDASQAQAMVDILNRQYETSRAQRARLLAERDNANTVTYPPDMASQTDDPEMVAIMAAQTNLFKARQQAYVGQVTVLKKKIGQMREQITAYRAQQSAQEKERDSITKEVSDLRELFERGFVTRTRMLDLERNATRLSGNIEESSANMARIRQTIEEAELQIVQVSNERLSQVALELRDVEARILDVVPRMQAARDVLARIEIRAPYDGTVLGLAVHSVEGVVGRGDRILDIVPDSKDLIVEAMVRVDDVDYVRPGASAEVRLSAFHSKGLLPIRGTMTQISADRVTDPSSGQAFYVVQVTIDQSDISANPNMQLQSGMNATVFIRTHSRTAWDYLMEPLTDRFTRALREP